MASGSNDQSLDLSTKINLLDGDMLYQIISCNNQDLNRRELYRLNIIPKINKKGLVYNAHLNFLNSGSTLIRTNTYHALYPYLKKELKWKKDNYEQFVQNAVNLAVQSADFYCVMKNIHRSSLNIVGSCGCFKNEILDSLPLEKLEEAHEQRIRILVESGVKTLSLEGIRNTEEAEMLLNIVREFKDTKTFVMFDGNQRQNLQLKRLVVWIQNCYNVYRPIITAIGLNNVNNETAIKFCKKIIKGRKTENLIPLVMCTTKSKGIAWNPIDVNSNAPVIEWKKFGIRYIGGGKNVVAKDIVSVREKLNG